MQSPEKSDNCFSLKKGESSHFPKGNRQIKTSGSSPMRVLLFLLSIFMVIYHRFYKPSLSIQLLNETKRQVQVGGDFRTITVIQRSQESRCRAYTLQPEETLNVTANWTRGCFACYDLNGKKQEQSIVWLISFSSVSEYVCAVAIYPLRHV